jgi:hypothetical protein
MMSSMMCISCQTNKKLGWARVIGKRETKADKLEAYVVLLVIYRGIVQGRSVSGFWRVWDVMGLITELKLTHKRGCGARIWGLRAV